MIDERRLTFQNPDPTYDVNREVILFWGEDNNKRKIACRISREALEDHFKLVLNKNAVEIFNQNQMYITQQAQRKYLSDRFEQDGSILLKTEDWL